MADNYVDGVLYPGSGGTEYALKPMVDATLTESGEAADAKVVGDALATKAEVDGSYDSMTVGNAEQLISTVYEEDSVPYQFRTSGGSIDIGDREEDTIIGGTVAWNQILDNMRASGSEKGLTFTRSENGLSISGTITEAFNYNYITFTNIVNIKRDGRKYLFLLNKTIPYDWGLGGYGGTFSSNAIGGIFTNNTGTDWANGLVFRAEVGETINIQNLKACIFDLTQMFGSIIADYIYSLEQTTAGAGVAWFRKLFPKPYYAYNPGELLSVSDLQSHDMVGFNAVDVNDPNNTSAYIDNTGTIMTNANWTTSGKVRVVSGSPYTLEGLTSHPNSGTDNYRLYDAAENYIGFVAKNIQTYPITFGAEVAYVQFCWKTEEKDSVCFHLVWDGERNGEYETYKKWSYPLDDSLTLRGIPKLDSANELYYDGDVYESDGTVTRKYGIVDLGTLNYSINNHQTIGAYFYANVTALNVKYEGSFPETIYPAICSKYTVTRRHQTVFLDKCFCFDGNVSGGQVTQVQIKDSAYSDAATFKSAMSGVYLVYELAEPTTETADPYQNPQIVDDFGTEEYVTTSIVPVGHETKYQPNLRAKLEMAPDSPDSNGTYVVKHENGENTYIPLTIPNPFPTYPYTPGNYRLQLQVTENSITLHWVEDN